MHAGMQAALRTLGAMQCEWQTFMQQSFWHACTATI